MGFPVTVLIFLIILFLYIHIVYQFKRSEDLEIYEMDFINNQQLQEVCDVKQPVLFDLKSVDPTLFENITFDKLAKHGSDDIRMIDTNDYWKEDDSTPDYVVLSFNSARKLSKSDAGSHYISENNQDFIEETGILKSFRHMDQYLKPSMVVHTKHDIMFGSNESSSPLRYHTNYRHYLAVTSGKIQIKMTPWRSNKYLHPMKDYDNYEFRSPINVWKPQSKYLNDMEKIKFLEFDVVPGYCLHIPPYWWYSIRYSNESDTCVCGVTYISAMNFIANLPNTCMYYLQQQNITKKVTKTSGTITEESEEMVGPVVPKNDDTDSPI
jgi:hypothetical protein